MYYFEFINGLLSGLYLFTYDNIKLLTNILFLHIITTIGYFIKVDYSDMNFKKFVYLSFSGLYIVIPLVLLLQTNKYKKIEI